MLKTILRKYLGEQIYNRLYALKIFFKRVLWLLLKGWAYFSVSGALDSLRKNLAWWRFNIHPPQGKKIIWLGAFPPMHSNMGDHAQTLAVENYFRDAFPDYQVIGLHRNRISPSRMKKIASSLTGEDLVFIHSSGDFGSKYHDLDNSFCKLRKEIIKIFSLQRIVNLPTTVYYENSRRGREILDQDRQFYARENVTILARENVSSEFLANHFSCNSRFFPDFVFYLKPELIKKTRKGALLLLRSDTESGLSIRERGSVTDSVKRYTEVIHDKDILKSSIPVVGMIRERYIASICRIYQAYEFVITDRMHGMILAVITRTPCIALNGGIPHKISAYQSFLSDSVTFIDHIDEMGPAIKKIRRSSYRETDMENFFAEFRAMILSITPSVSGFEAHVQVN